MMELSIPRNEARVILEDVATSCGEDYTIVRMGGCGNKFGLGTEGGSVFSITAKDMLYSAAHEKSMADQRDLASTNDGWMELLSIFSSSTNGIVPAGEYLDDDGRVRRVSRDRRNTTTTTSSSSSIPSATIGTTMSPKLQQRREAKETTAAAFFGTTEKTNPKTVLPKTTNAGVNNKRLSSNVDDFIGDEDEDEEFLQQESERKARILAREEGRVTTTNQPRKETSPVRKPTKMEEDTMDVVEGAMDAFAKRAIASGGGAKKRRKKLVEKTIMEDGYLKTVTEEIWEEYEDDGTMPPSKSATTTSSTTPSSKRTKTVSSGTKGKKQGNLMGFFGKK